MPTHPREPTHSTLQLKDGVVTEGSTLRTHWPALSYLSNYARLTFQSQWEHIYKQSHRFKIEFWFPQQWKKGRLLGVNACASHETRGERQISAGRAASTKALGQIDVSLERRGTLRRCLSPIAQHHLRPAVVCAPLTMPTFLPGPHGSGTWALSAVLTRIHYKADPVNGDRGLSNVGGQDALPYSSWSHIKHLGQGRRSHKELTQP